MRTAAIIALALAAGTAANADGEAARRVCLAPASSRAAILEHRLIEAAAALRSAVNQFGAEALGARLCRADTRYVYEITLLRVDGRVIHVIVDATSGKVVGSRNQS